MPESLDGVLNLLRTVGAGPLFGAAAVLILLRVATPEAIRGAVKRLYTDICPLVRDYWKARIDARRAEADRDRTISDHWRGTLLATDSRSPAPSLPGGAVGGAGVDSARGVGAPAPALENGEAVVGSVCVRRDCPFRDGGGGELGERDA